MKTQHPFNQKITSVSLRAGLAAAALLAHEGAFASASSSSPSRVDSPSYARTLPIPMDALPSLAKTSDVDLSDGSFLRTTASFKINSWTLPPLSRLDQSMGVIGGRELQRPIPTRDDYFNTLVEKAQKGERGAIRVTRQEVRGEVFLPLGFDASQQYKALVYAPGSGGLCESERTLVTRMANELNALFFVMESNRSRSKDDKGSSAEDQLSQNHLNLALDVLRMGEILTGHPNVKGLAAAGSSLGAVACTVLGDRALSGPMYAGSTFVKRELTDSANQWINASPFQALFLLTPIFPVQFDSTRMPSGLHMSLFLGSHDMWCEPFSALRAVSRTQGGMSVHLLKMGHGPESGWSEWDGRIARHGDKLAKLTHDGTDLVHCKIGQNISRCTSQMMPFWVMSLFNTRGLSVVPTNDDMSVLGPMASVPMKALGPFEAADTNLPFGPAGLEAIMNRTTRGTLLEPNEDAVAKIIEKMRGDLATFVTGAPWDESVWSASLLATSRAKTLASTATHAFDGQDGQRLHAIATDILNRTGRLATADELLKIRTCYVRVLDPLAEDVS